jgi:hypothetical protein
MTIPSDETERQRPVGCGSRLYHYYVSADLLKHDAALCTVRRIPAAKINSAAVDQLAA